MTYSAQRCAMCPGIIKKLLWLETYRQKIFLKLWPNIYVQWILIRMRAFAFLFSIGGGSKVEVWFSYVALIRTLLNSNRALIQ